MRSTDAVFVAGDLNVQAGYLTETEQRIGGRFSAPTERTDNGDRLTQICSDHRLANTTFCHKYRHLHTRRFPFAFIASHRHTVTVTVIYHRYRSSVKQTRRGLPVILDYTCELKPGFGLSPLLFRPSVWLHQHENHACRTTDSRA